MNEFQNNPGIPNFELNEEFLKALDFIDKTKQHVFLTGKAGTGKSTFLQFFRGHTQKNIVVLAPTGVAAVNVKGQTIHSFFNFKPDITPDNVSTVQVSPQKRNLYKKIETLVIDEVSMVRADLMDCIDKFLRLYGNHEHIPFGGVQLVMIGDLYQLPPVVRPTEKHLFTTLYQGPYFFCAKFFQHISLEYIEFERNYRQTDEKFIAMLNHIRANSVTQYDIDAFNERHQEYFEPDEKIFYVYLTTTNQLADRINYDRLHNLSEDLFVNEGVLTGEIEIKELPTHPTLELKVGAQVIMLNNDPNHRWVNGSVGKIIDIFTSAYNALAVQIELTTGERIEVEPYTWEIFNFFYNEETDAIESQTVGSFRQFPLKLAWAITIHKSQGKTFDNVIIDVGSGTFCHGQMYVALSRCRTLNGIILKRPINMHDIFMDRQIIQFLTQLQYQQAEKDIPLQRKKKLIEDAIAAGCTIDIIYLKEDNQKSTRTITPKCLRKIEYKGESCWGVEAFCLNRDAHWIFRLNCILSIKDSNVKALEGIKEYT